MADLHIQARDEKFVADQFNKTLGLRFINLYYHICSLLVELFIGKDPVYNKDSRVLRLVNLMPGGYIIQQIQYDTVGYLVR